MKKGIIVLVLFGVCLLMFWRITDETVKVNNIEDKDKLITITYSSEEIQKIKDQIRLGGMNFEELKRSFKIQCMRETYQGYYVIFKQDDGKEVYVFISKEGKVKDLLVVEDFKTQKEFEDNITVGMTLDELYAFDSTSMGMPISAILTTAHLVEEGTYIVCYKREFGETLLERESPVIESIKFISNEELLTSNLLSYYILEIDRCNN